MKSKKDIFACYNRGFIQLLKKEHVQINIRKQIAQQKFLAGK